MIGLEGITNTIPDLPAPMGPPPTPPQLPKPTGKRKRANADHTLAYKRKRRNKSNGISWQVKTVLDNIIQKVIKVN